MCFQPKTKPIIMPESHVVKKHKQVLNIQYISCRLLMLLSTHICLRAHAFTKHKIVRVWMTVCMVAYARNFVSVCIFSFALLLICWHIVGQVQRYTRVCVWETQLAPVYSHAHIYLLIFVNIANTKLLFADTSSLFSTISHMLFSPLSREKFDFCRWHSCVTQHCVFIYLRLCIYIYEYIYKYKHIFVSVCMRARYLCTWAAICLRSFNFTQTHTFGKIIKIHMPFMRV